MCKNKSFKELYESAKSKPTPAQSFIEEVASLTHRSANTVKMWLVGRQEPDELAKSILANHFKVEPASLFPKNDAQNTEL